MRTWTKGTARAALLTAGFVALGSGSVFSGVAVADTDGHHSILGGNQVEAPVNAPVDISGNAVAILGKAVAGSKGGAKAGGGSGSGGGQSTSGKHSVAGGNQVYAPVNAPVNVCGNSVAVLGSARSGCEGGAKAGGGSGSGGGQSTSGKHSVAGGNQVNVPVNAPVNVCGNAVGNAKAGCEGGATTGNGGSGDYDNGQGGRTSGDHSVAGGNQVKAPINAPVEVCGNAVALLGHAAAVCEGGASTGGGNGSGGGQQTSGDHSVAGGNQVKAPINAPVDVCGNAAAVVGHAVAGCGDMGQLPPGGGDDCSPCGGHGDDGYGDDYDNAITQTGQMAGVSQPNTPALPVVDQAGSDLPVTPGSALPAVRELPVQAPAAPLPVESAAPAVPGQLTGPVNQVAQILQTPPSAQTLQGVPALPDAGKASLPTNVPATLPSGGPVVPGGLITRLPEAKLPKADLPKADLPTDVTTGEADRTTGRTTGKEPAPVQAGLPVNTDVITGHTGSVTSQLGALNGKGGVISGGAGNVQGDLDAVKNQVTGMVPMAAAEPVSDRSGIATMSLVLLGGLLAGFSAFRAFGRRGARSGR